MTILMITGGLPRVNELFEARKPKEPATISEIDGVVKLGSVVKGMRKVIVEGGGGVVACGHHQGEHAEQRA